MTLPPSGWYPDPNEPMRQRYWNGERWTDDFAPAPPAAFAPPPPGPFAPPQQSGDFAPPQPGAFTPPGPFAPPQGYYPPPGPSGYYPPPGPPGYFIPAAIRIPYESARCLAMATVVLLAITALLSIGSAFVSFDRASLISDFLSNPRSVSTSDIQSADDRVRAFALLGLASYLATGIVFVLWFQRCYKNSQALGTSNLRFSSGWAAGAWFVPFLNLVRPKQIADDIWKSTDPSAPAMQNSAWMSASVPPLLHLWWALFIGGSIASRVVASLANNYDTLSELRTLDRVMAVTEIVTVVGAILAALVVRAMTARIEQRAKNLAVAP